MCGLRGGRGGGGGSVARASWVTKCYQAKEDRDGTAILWVCVGEGALMVRRGLVWVHGELWGWSPLTP